MCVCIIIPRGCWSYSFASVLCEFCPIVILWPLLSPDYSISRSRHKSTSCKNDFFSKCLQRRSGTSTETESPIVPSRILIADFNHWRGPFGRETHPMESGCNEIRYLIKYWILYILYYFVWFCRQKILITYQWHSRTLAGRCTRSDQVLREPTMQFIWLHLILSAHVD